MSQPQAKRRERDPDYLTASEIAAFHYCPESWRLGSVLKKKPANADVLDQGTREHEQWQVTEQRSHTVMNWAVIVAAIAFGIAVLALVFR